MALSMDEQRILEEMERKLAEDDPALAASMTAFRPRGITAALRSRRARVVLTTLALTAITLASVLVYVLSPFRDGIVRNSPGRTATPRVTQPTPSHRSATASQRPAALAVTTRAVGSPQPRP
jgi:Protein of unknown function (DUF3040)